MAIVDEGGEAGEAGPRTRTEREAARRSRLADFRASFTNLPNLLTMGRVLAIPAVLACIDNFSPSRSFIACLIYLAAAITDSLDGYLARRRKQVSLLGKFLDPLADKLIVSATLVYLAVLGRCPPWLVVALLARDLAVTGLRSLAAAEGLVISASDSGKQKTAFQMTAIIFLLIHFRYRVLLTHYTLDYHLVGLYTLYLSLVMSVVSAMNYVRLFVRALYAPRAAD
jgi:CDP-diacylglycerol--glycerol-3-phosphate 3-phosphatidyltransferase